MLYCIACCCKQKSRMDKFVLYFYLINMYFLIKIKVLILVKKTLISFLLTVYLMGFSSRWRGKMFWFDMKPKPFAKDRNAMELKKNASAMLPT